MTLYETVQTVSANKLYFNALQDVIKDKLITVAWFHSDNASLGKSPAQALADGQYQEVAIALQNEFGITL